MAVVMAAEVDQKAIQSGGVHQLQQSQLSIQTAQVMMTSVARALSIQERAPPLTDQMQLEQGFLFRKKREQVTQKSYYLFPVIQTMRRMKKMKASWSKGC